MTAPKIMVCITSKNDAMHLDEFFKEMEALDYPKENLRWVWMYGKSVDNTLDKILEFHKSRKYKYAVYQEPLFYNATRSSMWIADLCNAFKPLIKDEEYVLFLDTDIKKIPPDTLKKLVQANKDIVAPFVWNDTKPRRFFDTYVFRYRKKPFGAYDIYKPPFMDSKVPVKVDSVGTFVLIKEKVFKAISWENPAPHFQFCKNARKVGYTVWTLPYVSLIHANIESTEPPHLSVEMLVYHGVLDRKYLEKMRDDGP